MTTPTPPTGPYAQACFNWMNEKTEAAERVLGADAATQQRIGVLKGLLMGLALALLDQDFARVALDDLREFQEPASAEISGLDSQEQRRYDWMEAEGLMTWAKHLAEGLSDK